MATNDNTPPLGEGNIPDDGVTLLADCATAAETVAQGIERVSGMAGLPQPVREELVLLQGLATQLVDAFENLRDWLHGRFGVTLAGLADGGGAE